MVHVRIRQIHNGIPSSWIYLQQQVTNIPEVTPKSIPSSSFSIQSFTIQATSSTNQYSRFRYGEKQYGELIGELGSNIEVSTTPIRIRSKDNTYIYLQQTTIEGACPAIRIRSVESGIKNSWVYLEEKEV